jgi:hypothetical protein
MIFSCKTYFLCTHNLTRGGGKPSLQKKGSDLNFIITLDGRNKECYQRIAFIGYTYLKITFKLTNHVRYR